MKRMQRKFTLVKRDTRKMCYGVALILLGAGFLLYSFFNGQSLLIISRILAILMLLSIILLRGKIEKSTIALLVPAGYFVLISASVSLNVLFAILFAAATCKLDDNFTISTLHKVNLFILAIVAVSLLAGVVENRTWTYLGRTRSSLGFIHPNYPGLLSFSVVSIYFIKCRGITIKSALIALTFSLAVFLLTDSRTGFYAILVMLIAYPILKKIPGKRLKFLTATFVVLLFASPFLWFLPGIKADRINTLLSLRPGIFRNYFMAHTEWNFLFGGSSVAEIDNFYLLLLFNCGIFFYIFVASTTVLSSFHLIEQNRYIELTFIFATLIVALFESSILRPEILCMPLFWKLALEKVLKGKKYMLFEGKDPSAIEGR